MFEPAACIIIPTRPNCEEIIAISRRDDFTQWGIPGGKQEKDESNVDCAVREIQEELILYIDKKEIHPIYSGACYGKDGRHFWVTTYVRPMPYNDYYGHEEGFQVKAMDMELLCHSEYSPFFEYNIMARNAWRSFKG